MPMVDLSFRLIGKTIPADHGYALFSAISRLGNEDEKLKAVHSAGSAPEDSPWRRFGVHPINGQPVGDRKLALTPRSRLTFRLDSDLIRELLPLAGKELDLDGSRVRVGVPTTYPLKPAATLRSRLVTIKHRLEPESFLEAVQAELTTLGVKGVPGLLQRKGKAALEGKSGSGSDRGPFIRRTLTIRNKDRPAEVVGYAVQVSQLNADESLKLQGCGLGGRRRFGCGIFVPVR